MDDLLSRISIVLERQDFRMCVPPESDDTDIVLEECRDAIESLRQQLAAALAACKAKDAALSECQRLFDPDEGSSVVFRRLLATDIRKAIYTQPDASALKQHDEALIERIALYVEEKFDFCGDELVVAEAIRELKRAIADGTTHLDKSSADS